MILFLIPIKKGWTREYYRRSKNGHIHKVSGHWKPDKEPVTSKKTWKEYNLPRWDEVMRKKASRLVKPIETVEDLNSFLHSLKEIFHTDKNGWVSLPSSYGNMYISIERKYYGHWENEKSRIEADNRIRYFRAAVETLIQPWEVWKQPVGKGNEDGRVFIAGYHVMGERDKSVVVMVGFRDNKPILWTTIPMSNYKSVDKKRWGELLFQDNE